MNKIQIRLKKLFELYGPSLAGELNIPVATLHQIIKNQNKTIPTRIIDRIEDIVEQDRKNPIHPDPGLFLPENADKGLIYAAMSRIQGSIAEIHVWYLYEKKPAYNVSERRWKTDDMSLKIEFHTIPWDSLGYGAALFERTEQGWIRCANKDTKVEDGSKQEKWDRKK